MKKTKTISLSTMLVTILAILAIVLGGLFVSNAFKPTANNVVRADDSGSCGTSATWSFDSDSGTLNISGTGAMFDYSYDDQPWRAYCSEIRRIVVGNGITHIGDYAFYYCYYDEARLVVDIGTGVKTIGEYAFSYMTPGNFGDNIMIIRGNLTYIDEHAFYNSSFRYLWVSSIGSWINVTLYSEDSHPFYRDYTDSDINHILDINQVETDDIYSIAESICNGYENIGDYEITTLNVPANTTVRSYQFLNCNGLNTLAIPSTSTFNEDAFKGCSFSSVDYQTSGTSFTFNNGTLTITDGSELSDSDEDSEYSWSYLSGLTNNLAFNCQSYSSIGQSAFEGFAGLISVVIPTGITKIERAFENCTNLNTVTIPASVTTIEYGAFESTNIHNLYMENLTLFTNGTLQYIFNVSSSGYGDPSPNHLYLNNELVTTLNLTGYEHNNGTIGGYMGLTDITTIIFPNTVTRIVDNAFSYCVGLNSLVFPESIVELSSNSFHDCGNIDSVIFRNNNISIGYNTFSRTTFNNVTLTKTGSCYTFEDGTLTITSDPGINNEPWNNTGFRSLIIDVVYGENLNVTRTNSFSQNKSMKSIRIPAGITYIGSLSNDNELTVYICDGTELTDSYKSRLRSAFGYSQTVQIICENQEDADILDEYFSNKANVSVQYYAPPAAPSTGIEVNIGVAIASLALVGTMFVVANKKRKEDR